MQAQHVHLLAVAQAVDLRLELLDGGVHLAHGGVALDVGAVLAGAQLGHAPLIASGLQRIVGVVLGLLHFLQGVVAIFLVLGVAHLGRGLGLAAVQALDAVERCHGRIELSDLRVLLLHGLDLALELVFEQVGALALHGQQGGFQVHALDVERGDGAGAVDVHRHGVSPWVFGGGALRAFRSWDGGAARRCWQGRRRTGGPAPRALPGPRRPCLPGTPFAPLRCP